MFISDKLIYIDLHKTACSHIRKLLTNTIGGQLVGKHNRAKNLDTKKYIIGSIRNPWDWYVSLWAYGCKNQGAIYGRATKKFDLDCYISGLKREMYTAGNPLWVATIKTMIADTMKPTSTWKRLYSDHNNKEHFREWLKLIYSQERKYDLGEGYAFTPISNYFGLYTYRYLKLYSDTIRKFYKTGKELDSEQAIVDFDTKHNILDATIRIEHLETDLIQALQAAGYELNEAQNKYICDGALNKTNTSNHKNRAYYFDEASIELITRKERLIIDKYNYSYSIGSSN